MTSTINRRNLLGAGLTAVTLSRVARAQPQTEWPNRPIRLIVPYPPAGGTDVISREMGHRIASATGWTIVVENRPGAGGNIGLDLVAKSEPDGYTIGMGQTANLAINPSLYQRMPFDPLTDLTPVSTVAQQPNVLAVRKDAPWADLAALVADAKRRPGALTVGHSGAGTTGHLSGEMFALRAGINLVVVPYVGAAPVLTDMLGGRIDMFFANPLAARGTLESGAVRPLAVTSPQRMRAMPDVLTVAELGYPGYEAVNWTGLVLPARTPEPVLARMNQVVRGVLQHPAVVARLAAEGSEPMGSSPEEFQAFLRAEHKKWGDVVRESKIQVG
ncbi:Bug family tripartite tricarboxylate transporter substrate binding protein [Roseomonas xinghualingensis]|uniref:Bug family tripartite tricarboxylate transporter substrate binding protein n=1 Tax=Roseomonas xinghualingensis TaxID=2986475 RepID=UPI0021F0DE65|nr:tripartite tricarboxylate transporter substrate binding protein [Roseomonas sp. SXEYE001]MCV4209408.1 tripartite tricarboxylate transporter substrate binding protein [Roseomonas sp. SXEYE001]